MSLFLWSLKKSDSQLFPDIFRGYRKRPVAWYELKSIQAKNIPENI